MKKVPKKPNTIFWELTRSCQLKCLHCRDSKQADCDESGIEQLEDIADQIVSMKIKYVVLTGGEPTLHPRWSELAKRLSTGGVKVRLFTNGFDNQAIQTALDLGISRFSISLDGPKQIHDELRPVDNGKQTSTYDKAITSIERIIKSGANVRAVTQVNRVNADHLPEIYDILVEQGVQRWQLQLCQITGRAQSHRDTLMCKPSDIEKVIDVLLHAAKEKMTLAPLHCTVGYMTQEEPVLRKREIKGGPIWMGCTAGLRTMTIDPNGKVKGCAALPDEFIVGSVKERSIADIWNDDDCFPYTRKWDEKVLGGLCLHCTFSNTCRAGCPAVAYSVTGSIGTNPYCLRIVRDL